MSDDAPDEPDPDAGGNAAAGAKTSVPKRVEQAAGIAADAVEGVASAAGEDDADVARGLEVAASVASTVQGAVAASAEQGEARQGGAVVETAASAASDVASTATGIGRARGGDAGREAIETVTRSAGAVRRLATTAAEVVRAGEALLEAQRDDSEGVDYEIEVQGSEARWLVQQVSLHERLGELGSCIVEAGVSHEQEPEETELLGKDFGLIIERGAQRRSFRGIVRHAEVRRDRELSWVHFDVAPALWLAAETIDSRIYQGLDVPTLVEQLVSELVGERRRSVRRELLETYAAHEYLVQHRESHWTFLKRICEAEGIFLYFDHDEEEREVLVLGDSNDNRPQVRPSHSGRVEYVPSANGGASCEVALRATRHRRVAATDVTVRGYDWTSPGLGIHREHLDRGEWEGPRLEHYHHDHAVRHHDYDADGGSYQSHTAERVAQMHTERLDAHRNRVTVAATVVTAMPGHTFELVGHDRLDGCYLIIGATATGRAGPRGGVAGRSGEGGSLQNTLTCIPVELPYRPPHPQRLRMPGPETATVVGPPGEEVHTDQYGRIKVQFHWDRQGQRDDRSSVWIRVNYGWAGPGWGQMFIPRIGMEVTVGFLGGDPDRPIVMGAVYNGSNRPPYLLPDNKTKSTIKTSSSPGGDGYNELRFEDKAGSEEIFTHAQKDYNEVVGHCHTTRVKVDQSNTVDHDQTETVGNDQSLEVKGERTKTVHKPETTYVFDDRTETVHGVETLDLRQTRQTTIGEDEDLTVLRDRKTLVKGTETQRVEGERTVVVTADDSLSVRNGGNRVTHIADGEYRISVQGKYLLVQGGTEKIILDSDQVYIESNKHVHVHAHNTDLNMTSSGEVSITAAQKILLDGGGTKLELSPSGASIEGPDIQAKAGESLLKLAASGATLKGSNVDILADMFATIKSILARIN